MATDCSPFSKPVVLTYASDTTPRMAIIVAQKWRGDPKKQRDAKTHHAVVEMPGIEPGSEEFGHEPLQACPTYLLSPVAPGPAR